MRQSARGVSVWRRLLERLVKYDEGPMEDGEM